MMDNGKLYLLVSNWRLTSYNVQSNKSRKIMDSEILRIEKRIKGLNRVTAAINDLSIYGIFYGNYPELVKVLEAAKDHCKAELKKSKERLESINYPSHDEGAEAVIQQYMQKGT